MFDRFFTPRAFARKRLAANSRNDEYIRQLKQAAIQAVPVPAWKQAAESHMAFKTATNRFRRPEPRPMPQPSRLEQVFQSVARRFQ